MKRLGRSQQIMSLRVPRKQVNYTPTPIPLSRKHNWRVPHQPVSVQLRHQTHTWKQNDSIRKQTSGSEGRSPDLDWRRLLIQPQPKEFSGVEPRYPDSAWHLLKTSRCECESDAVNLAGDLWWLKSDKWVTRFFLLESVGCSGEVMQEDQKRIQDHRCGCGKETPPGCCRTRKAWCCVCCQIGSTPATW